MTLTLATAHPAPAWADKYVVRGKRWLADMLYGDVYGFPCGALLWRDGRVYRPRLLTAHYALMADGKVYIARETTRLARNGEAAREATVNVIWDKLADCGLDWREAVQLWVCLPEGLAGAEMLR